MFLDSHNKEECVGCRACADVCPKRCIHMEEDEEGFLYPVIDKNECIKCNLCKNVCPIKFNDYCKIEDQTAWVGLHRDSEICFQSSSGGAFTAISEILIDRGYRVYGVKWGDNFKVIHDAADTKQECAQFRKSKYVFSDTNHCYNRICDELREHKKILFTGTPCQCAALYKFLAIRKVDKTNLLIVDIICHGAPNQKLFDKYIGESQIGVFEFRFKNKIPFCGTVNSRSAQVIYLDGTQKIIHAKNDPFMKGYYSRLFYRPSCAKCHFACIERCSDITIGDAWGIEAVYPQYDALSGVSLLLMNSSKGAALLNDIKSQMDIKTVDVQWAQNANAQLNRPTQMHKGRSIFFEQLKYGSFQKAVEKAMRVPLWRKCIRRVRALIGGDEKLFCTHLDCPLNTSGYCTVKSKNQSTDVNTRVEDTM